MVHRTQVSSSNWTDDSVSGRRVSLPLGCRPSVKVARGTGEKLIVEHLRAIRMRLGLRQRDLAAAVGMGEHQIRKWERGLAMPSSSVMAALAELLDVPPDELERAQRAYSTVVEAGEGYTTARARYSAVQGPAIDEPLGDKLGVFDLYCGAGGLAFGLEQTGGFRAVAGLDLLPDRVGTFCLNHPYATGFAADIRSFPTARLDAVVQGVDVVAGGPPCQGFSSIRPFRTLTEGDKRNSLVEDFVLVVSRLRPRWIVFENVVGILTHRRGRMLASLLESFEAGGYEVSWRVMNASLYGVPQNRERLFIVGNRVGADFEWPAPSHRNEYKSMAGSRREVIRTAPLFSQDLPDAVTVMEAIGDLPEVQPGQSETAYGLSPQNAFQAWARGPSQLLTMHDATRHSKHMREIIKHAGPNISSIPKELIRSGFSSSYSRLDPDSPSTTLTVNFVHPASNRCIHPVQDRALTPREGARLQSFPDSYRFAGTRAQIVKQIGNAVPPLLARSVGHAILAADRRIMAESASSRFERRETAEAV